MCATGIARSIRRFDFERVVLATVKGSIVPWTGADWVFFPATSELVLNPTPGAVPAISVRYDDDATDEEFERALPKPPPPPPADAPLTSDGGAAVSDLFFNQRASKKLTSAVTKDVRRGPFALARTPARASAYPPRRDLGAICARSARDLRAVRDRARE